jgi:hypothetical protein
MLSTVCSKSLVLVSEETIVLRNIIGHLMIVINTRCDFLDVETEDNGFSERSNHKIHKATVLPIVIYERQIGPLTCGNDISWQSFVSGTLDFFFSCSSTKIQFLI